MRFGFQDDNQQVGIRLHRSLAVNQMCLVAGSFELTLFITSVEEWGVTLLDEIMSKTCIVSLIPK